MYTKAPVRFGIIARKGSGRGFSNGSLSCNFRDHFFVDNRSKETCQLFDRKVSRVLQAAGMIVRRVCASKQKLKDRLIIKQCETLPTNKAEIKARRKAISKRRNAIRRRAYNRLNELPGQIQDWKATI